MTFRHQTSAQSTHTVGLMRGRRPFVAGQRMRTDQAVLARCDAGARVRDTVPFSTGLPPLPGPFWCLACSSLPRSG